MKIIKPVLLGPKLIAVGPLKCFKGGGGGSSGGGGGGGGGGGKGGGGSSSSSSSSSGSKGGTPTESAQARESKELAKQMKKEEEERVKSETSMGGQLSGMDFSDITRDPETGEQTGQAKKRDDRTGLEKVGGFFKGLAGGTFSTDKDEQDAAFNKAEAERVSRQAGRRISVDELKEFEEQGGGTFGGPSAKEFFGQKDRAAAEGVKDFVFTDKAEVAKLEAEEKAAADLQKARELEAKRVEEEVSPFTKQLAGVDIGEAEFAGKMRQTPLEERQRLAQEEIDKLGSDRIEEAKQKRMREMGFLDRLTGKEPGFQAARVGPEEIEAIERKYQVDEVEDPGSKALDEFQQSDQFKETLQRERGLLAQNKALEAQQAAEERKTLERELAQRRPRPELAEPEPSPFSKQLSKVDIDKAVQAQDRRARVDQTLARELAKRREGKELSQMAREERESMEIGSKMQADYENRVRKKQAEMDLARGNIQADEYEAVTGEKAPNQLVNQGLRAAKGLARGMVKRAVSPTGVPDVEGAAEKAKSYDLADAATDVGLAALGPAGLVAKGLGVDEKVKDFISPVTDPLTRAAKRITDPVVDAVSGAVSPITKPITDKLKAGQQAVMGATDKALGLNQGPVGFTEAAEALAEEQDPNRTQQVTTRSGGDRSSGAGILAPLAGVAATALAPKPKPFEVTEVPEVKPGGGKIDVQGERADLVDALKKQASGEESLAEKQIRRTQDRSLAQRLAALKSMRGQDSGSKLRSFSRASDKARREAEGQIEIAGMKERRSAQDQLRAQLDTMSREEATERWKKINFDEKQRLLKMSREDAIKKGEYNKWLTVAAMGQKFFKDEIKDAGDWAKTNVLDPVIEGGKKLAKKAGDFVKDAFGFDEGGFVSGPGTEMSDSIPARLSDGEFVIKASAVRGIGKSLGAKDKKEERKKGVDFLYKLQDKMDKAEKFAKGGEAYARPKKAFREAIGYKPESRFHDKAEKDAKHGGARRKFRHFQQGGPVSLDVKGMKPQFNIPQSQGFGSVVAAQQDLQRRLEELERQMGR